MDFRRATAEAGAQRTLFLHQTTCLTDQGGYLRNAVILPLDISINFYSLCYEAVSSLIIKPSLMSLVSLRHVRALEIMKTN